MQALILAGGLERRLASLINKVPMPARAGNLEETTFPLLAKRGRLKAVLYRDVFWRSIDAMKDLEEVERILANEQR